MARQLNVSVPEELAERLKALSEATGIPQARIVRDALEGRLEGVGPAKGGETLVRVEEVGLTPVRQEMDRGEVGQKPAAGFRCPREGCKHTSKSSIGYCEKHDELVVPA